MKNITYYKKELGGNRGRMVSVRESSTDKDCDATVRKNYVYLVARVDAVPKNVPPPNVRIIKSVDSVTHCEMFQFRVKGDVYFKKGRFLYQVHYLHGLKVRMLWKNHVLSSTPATLT